VTETTSTCSQLDVQSAVTTVSASPDLLPADQSTSDFSVPPYPGWSASCRYADHAAPAVTYHPLGYDTTSTTAKQYVEYLPCNMQQRLVCGGASMQYHSPGGAVFNDAIQQRALSDLSGMSFGPWSLIELYEFSR